ncbi:MAG: lipid-binding SYLF domain-containing protein [Campylobacteraceae bacterium]|jgi:lipid-binding SYLF domain-containing protein|nr:lipid-binding SYLF domain-containing protein [Campylobacteraceae bacterium]
MNKIVKIILSLSILFNFASASEEDILNASNAFQLMLRSSNSNIPKEVLENAKAIAILPDSFRAGFIISGTSGSGIMSVRNNNRWSNPVFVSVSGGNIGLQAGFEKSDKLFIFLTDESIDKVINGGLKFGADATVAAGPLGISRKNMFTADVYAYAQERGLFAGVSVGGLVLSADDETTMATYGRGMSVQNVINGNRVPYSYAVEKFLSVLKKEFK